MAKCQAALNNNITVTMTSEYEIWLENTSGSDQELSAGELFGYGLGKAEEKPSGREGCLLIFMFGHRGRAGRV